MEKRISFFEFQSVKNVAKAVEPLRTKQNVIMGQIEKLADEYKKCQADIDAYQAGIVNIIGFSVDTLVKKVVETKEKDGKETKYTKYVPTEYVTYDAVAKQYIINVPDETKAECPECVGDMPAGEDESPEPSFPADSDDEESSTDDNQLEEDDALGEVSEEDLTDVKDEDLF